MTKKIKLIVALLLTFVMSCCFALFGCSEKDTASEPPAGEIMDNSSSPIALNAKVYSTENDENSYEITAVVKPDGAAVTWSIDWDNPNSEWASGKSVADYLNFTYDGYTARVSCKQAFGERAKISAVVSAGSVKAEAIKYVDYSLKLAYEISEDGLYYIVTGLEDGETGICTVDKIPETYSGLPVKEIGEKAFYGCNSLVSITIPDSVVCMGTSAFWGCTSLSQVVLSSSLLVIPISAFASCSSLQSFYLPSGLVNIGNFAFSGCVSLISITIPYNVRVVGYFCFSGCSSLTTVVFENISGWRFSNTYSNESGTIDVSNSLLNAQWLTNSSSKSYASDGSFVGSVFMGLFRS